MCTFHLISHTLYHNITSSTISVFMQKKNNTKTPQSSLIHYKTQKKKPDKEK